MVGKLRFNRIVLKCSGELLSGPGKSGIDFERVTELSREIASAKKLGAEIGLVIGGGNILRGNPTSQGGMERVNADYMGMLATVINALALQNGLEQEGVHTRVMTAIKMEQLAEPYIRRRALRHLEKGRIVIFAGGTGNPYFTTDTAAALRAIEVNAEAIFKGTKVDGVFEKDPVKHPDAKKYETLSYLEVLNKELGVMDATAVSLCKDNSLPIVVFNFNVKKNLERVLLDEKIGTTVS
jgi:uridylate kinase